jgi:hypothetical protein
MPLPIRGFTFLGDIKKGVASINVVATGFNP